MSEPLGHSDTRITREIYQSVMPKTTRDAAKATAAIVPRGASRQPAPDDGHAKGTQGDAKIIEFRPRKVTT